MLIIKSMHICMHACCLSKCVEIRFCSKLSCSNFGAQNPRITPLCTDYRSIIDRLIDRPNRASPII